MLYPLSYEGLRPISYRPGDTHECPGVPQAANRCRRVLRWRFRPWSEDMRSIFRAYAGGLPGGDHGCPALISGAIRSPSTSGALAMPSEQPKRLSAVDLTFARGHVIVRAPVPRGAPPAAAKPGTSRTRCPARGFHGGAIVRCKRRPTLPCVATIERDGQSVSFVVAQIMFIPARTTRYVGVSSSTRGRWPGLSRPVGRRA
jgi:hypothetical protein